MNQVNKTELKREQNMRKEFLKNMNAVKNTKYSSIYVVICFFEQTVVLELLKDMVQNRVLYFFCGVVSFVVMFLLFDKLQKRAKAQIESMTSFPESKNDKLIECATMLGYMSPILCFISWLSGFNESESVQMKWFFIALVIILGIVLPLVGKKKDS